MTAFIITFYPSFISFIAEDKEMQLSLRSRQMGSPEQKPRTRWAWSTSPSPGGCSRQACAVRGQAAPYRQGEGSRARLWRWGPGISALRKWLDSPCTPSSGPLPWHTTPLAGALRAPAPSLRAAFTGHGSCGPFSLEAI